MTRFWHSKPLYADFEFYQTNAQDFHPMILLAVIVVPSMLPLCTQTVSSAKS